MSTRCRIGIKLEDGTIKSIYCHHDGYPSGVGATLKEFWTNRNKVMKLMELGDISSLGETLEHNKEDWNKMSHNNRCLIYADRGENCPAIISKDLNDFNKDTNECWGEYAWLFELDGTWNETLSFAE